MRIDHIAYRTKNRLKTAQFFIDALGYKIQTTFDLKFADGTTTECIALEPPEKIISDMPWTAQEVIYKTQEPLSIGQWLGTYHLAPEIFVSDGPPDSIVGKWVAERNNIGGIHHIAYQVESVEQTMKEWKEKGYAEFTTDQPLTCPGLTQCFTKPSELTGVIYEFIERGAHGFCKENVLSLMESTKDIK